MIRFATTAAAACALAVLVAACSGAPPSPVPPSPQSAPLRATGHAEIVGAVGSTERADLAGLPPGFHAEIETRSIGVATPDAKARLDYMCTLRTADGMVLGSVGGASLDGAPQSMTAGGGLSMRVIGRVVDAGHARYEVHASFR